MTHTVLKKSKADGAEMVARASISGIERVQEKSVRDPLNLTEPVLSMAEMEFLSGKLESLESVLGSSSFEFDFMRNGLPYLPEGFSLD